MAGQSNPAHLFFSYAHADEKRLMPIHAQMQNVLERNLWIDKVGLDRGTAWENAIKAAIDDSYGVIFAVTEAFVASKFIREKEITWTLAQFKDKQGAQIFPILFDDVDVPDHLKTPFITHLIDARDGDMARVYAELKRVLPEAKAGTQPFVVSWPRLTNFKGRDSQLIDLHRKLMNEGHSGVKISGLHGMGGIGKTQLAVEYAHRYRYHYPGGVYWLNAGADWQKEVGACAVNLDRSLVDKKDEEKALAFRDFLAAQDKEALLVLDNVDDPAEVTWREIAPKLTLFDLRGQTKARLLLTTRVQTMPAGFESVSVNVLDKDDARAVLLEAWADSKRKDTADVETLDKIGYLLGYLPLALGWIEAALRQLPETTPTELLDELKARGLDDLIQELRDGQIDIGTPAYHDRLVGSVLDWQIKQLKSADAPTLLALTAAFGEAAVVPLERLRLMMGLPEKALIKPFTKAVKDVQAYSLVETLNDGTAFRLHPLTQGYIAAHLKAVERLVEAVPRLVAAYRNPPTLDVQTRVRGFRAVMEDLRVTQSLSTSYELDALTRLLTLEEPHFLVMPDNTQVGYIIQQVRERAQNEGDDNLKAVFDIWLKAKWHMHLETLRYPTSEAMLRVMTGHSGRITGALELVDGRILSWAHDSGLRIWSAAGEPLANMIGHSDIVKGTLELIDSRILSWAYDNSLRLWSAAGESLGEMTGHSGSVTGALELANSRILSWASDSSLRLWSATGESLGEMTGHSGSVTGALELADGRILSWASDSSLRLWSATGESLEEMTGHSGSITGALELVDGRILSWAHDSSLRLWDKNGRLFVIMKGHIPSANLFSGGITGALELVDGRILSWASDSSLRLWSAAGEPLGEMTGHSGSVTGALQLADSRILSWSADTNLRLWSAAGESLEEMTGHSGSVTGALQLADSRILSWSADTNLRLWSAAGEPLGEMTGHSGSVEGAMQLVDSRILSWSADTNLRLWLAVDEPLGEMTGHSGSVVGVLELIDGRILSWSSDSNLRLWSALGEPLARMTGHSGSVEGAMQLVDSSILSWSSDGSLRLWSALGEPLAKMTGHSDIVKGTLQLADGRILSWSSDSSLRLWSATGEQIEEMLGHSGSVEGALQLADGRILSWAYDRSLRLWSADGQTLVKVVGHNGRVRGGVELKNGRILSWSYDNSLRLWSAVGEPLAKMTGHSDWIQGAQELKDGRILSWAYDSNLWLWSAVGEPLAKMTGHSDWIKGALELKDGCILSWSEDWTVRLWSTDGKPLVTYSSDSPITCCIEAKDGRIVVGDTGGRVLFLTLEEGE